VYEWVEVPRDDAGVAKIHDGSAQAVEGRVHTRAVGSTVETQRQGRPDIDGGIEYCYLPGLTFEDYRPVRAGIFVPAGSDMLLNIHYTTNGAAVIDRSRIGFTVAKLPPAKKFVHQTTGGEGDESFENPVGAQQQANEKLAIPPYDGNYVAPPTDITFKKDTELVSLRPHAHVRAKSVRYTLIYPDGREEVVLDVPHYDFNWQLTYRTWLNIPKGSRMHVQFSYDNSPGNKYNPDPSKWVYYGGQSWEEMGSPFLGFLTDRNTKEEDLIEER